MLKPTLAAVAAASLFALGACTQEVRVEDEPTAEQAIENAGAEIEQAGENAAADIEQAGENAGQSIDNATDGNPNTTP